MDIKCIYYTIHIERNLFCEKNVIIKKQLVDQIRF